MCFDMCLRLTINRKLSRQPISCVSSKHLPLTSLPWKRKENLNVLEAPHITLAMEVSAVDPRLPHPVVITLKGHWCWCRPPLQTESLVIGNSTWLNLMKKRHYSLLKDLVTDSSNRMSHNWSCLMLTLVSPKMFSIWTRQRSTKVFDFPTTKDIELYYH